MSNQENVNSSGEDNSCEDTLATRFDQAVALVETSPRQAADQLTALQSQAATLFSSNESLDDIATGTIPFLALEYHLATALVQIPTGPTDADERLHSLRTACDLWQAFLERLDRLEQLSKDEQAQLSNLMELSSSSPNSSSASEQNASSSSFRMPPPISRELKIARFREQQAATQATAKLKALQERRKRLGVGAAEEMDGHDDESLARSLHILTTLTLAKVRALEAWSSSLQELPLVARMAQAATQQQAQQGRYGSSNRSSSSRPDTASARPGPRPPPVSSNKPLQVTQITKDAATGQLRMQRQEVRSTVFRPGWNQPTMTLEELAEREVSQALEREARQKQHEAAQKEAPRRYEQLERDGMEDNADLVDASAALDRQWDDFKDENPRGSGNKRADVGDRNF